MIGAVLAVVALTAWLLIGRKRSWVPRRVLRVGLAWQISGLIACLPMDTPLDDLLEHLTGISHIRFFIGHLCFIGAAGAIIRAVAHQVTSTDEDMNILRLKVETPGAVTAAVMLMCLINSGSLKPPCPREMLQIPCDPWLTLYWFALGAQALYLTTWMIKLLRIARRDPRSRAMADVFTLTAASGVIVSLLLLAHPFIRAVTPKEIWTPVLLMVGAGLSGWWWVWHRRGRDQRI